MTEAMTWILAVTALIVGGGFAMLWIGFLVISVWAISDHGPGDPPMLAAQDDDE